MKAVVAAFNQEKALVGAFSVITNLRMELFQAVSSPPVTSSPPPLTARTLPPPRLCPSQCARCWCGHPTVSKFSCCCVLVAWCRKEWVVVLLSLVRLTVTVPHPAKSITDISCCWAADGRSSAAPPPPPRDHSAHRPATTTFGQPGADRSRVTQ